MVDDGSAEDAVGLTAGGDTICLNEFTVVPGSETIQSVEIAWGTPLYLIPAWTGCRSRWLSGAIQTGMVILRMQSCSRLRVG